MYDIYEYQFAPEQIFGWFQWMLRILLSCMWIFIFTHMEFRQQQLNGRLDSDFAAYQYKLGLAPLKSGELQLWYDRGAMVVYRLKEGTKLLHC